MSLDQVTISPILSFWAILLLLILGLGAVVLQLRPLRKTVRGSKAVVLSFLRLVSLFSIISFALNPSLEVKKEERVPQSIAILLDTSQSMGLPGTSGKRSRLDDAKALLIEGADPMLRSLAERFHVKLYSLGESFRPLDVEGLPTLKARGKEGDLTEAMERLADNHDMAILFSDGNLRWKDGSSKRLPLIAVPLGDPDAYRDIVIKDLQAPAIAFRGREVSIDITLKGYGYKGLTLPIHLKDGNKLVTAKNVTFDDPSEEVKVAFSFTPEELGLRHLSIGVPPQSAEGLRSNNRASFSLRVVRDKIRILMISGGPSLGYRFMRMAFKNDPSIDLLSFVVLRTPSDIINVPLQEQSLIPLPIETLFTKELKNFDLLIFDNLPSHLYLKPSYFESIKEFVKTGGAFAMIGGPFLSDEGRYLGTAIEEILPVKLIERPDYRRGASWKVRLSQAGRAHPITRLAPDEADNLGLWEEMASLDGINLLVAKPSATVLLEGEDGKSIPILTVGHYGSGRVLVLATDYSWKWYMGWVAKGREGWSYFRLMERIVRWLTKDPSLHSIQAILPEEKARMGQEVEIRLKLGGEVFPDRKEALSFSVLDPSGLKIRSHIRRTGKGNEYIVSFLPEKEGVYRLKIESGGSELEEHLPVASAEEGLDGLPHPERLKTISMATGGRYVSHESDPLREIEALAQETERHFVEMQSFPLWGKPYALIFILFLLSTEWYLRRRWGLP